MLILYNIWMVKMKHNSATKNPNSILKISSIKFTILFIGIFISLGYYK